MGLTGKVLQFDPMNCTMTRYPSRISHCYGDVSRAGDVYLLVFNGSGASKGFTHQAILIDVSGECTGVELCGVTMHLTANPTDGQTSFEIDDRLWDKTLLYDAIHLGKIETIQSSPFIWACNLLSMGHQWYNQFIEKMGGKPHWNSQINCHTFSRFLMEKLNVRIPHEVAFSDDFPPIIVDLSILTTRAAIITTDKTQRLTHVEKT